MAFVQVNIEQAKWQKLYFAAGDSNTGKEYKTIQWCTDPKLQGTKESQVNLAFTRWS